MDEPYDEEGQSLSEVRRSLDLPEDVETTEGLSIHGRKELADAGPNGPEGEGFAASAVPSGGNPPPEAAVEAAVELAVARLKLGPDDVLAVVVPEILSTSMPMAQVSESVQLGLASRGLNNLVLVFPHGTELSKVKLTKKQIAQLGKYQGPRTQVVEAEDDKPIQRSAFGGFSRG